MMLLLGAQVWATSVLLAYPKSAEVDFTEASWSPTQLAEVDTTDVPKKSGYLPEVCQPEAACARSRSGVFVANEPKEGVAR